jgi:IS4 transposase
MDRGYVDFRLFARWDEDGIFFVTRPLHHMVFEVAQSHPVPKNSTIRSDQTIRFNSDTAQRHGFKLLLRRIVVWNEEHQQDIVLLSNHFGFAASTLAAIYKERWEIELFFKALKQNLKIKTFVGTTENALHIQIWTALIAMLLLKWLHHLSKANWSLSNLATMLRLNLFTYRDLRDWLHNPFGTPPILPAPEQLRLELA